VILSGPGRSGGDELGVEAIGGCVHKRRALWKTGVTADRDKIEFRLFNSTSIFNITLREKLSSYRSKTRIRMHGVVLR